MRLHHVSIPAQPDTMKDAGRDFYGALLGLPEIPAPESLGLDRVVWFQAGECELHLFIEEEPDTSSTGRHFCFAVDDLEKVRARLEDAGVVVEESTLIHNRPRFFCADPFGNRLELTEILGSYR